MGKTQFVYKNATLPADPALAQKIEEATRTLYEKLLALDYMSMPVSDYNKRYFGEHLHKITFTLRACCFILFWSIYRSGKNVSELCLCDYGGGTGILALLAKAIGIKTVLYNDLYDVSCSDAAHIGHAIGFEADGYIHGEIPEVGNFCKAHSIHCDIITSRNVIEHIYDLDHHFSGCDELFPAPLILFHATTANVKNPLIDFYTRKLHRIAEYKGKKEEWGFKKMDSVHPFSILRRAIITDAFPELSQKIVDRLAQATRGLQKNDILQSASEYLKTKKIPPPPADPTNTCDPLTGNWEEHLVPLKEYGYLAKKNNFTFEVINGFYNTNYPFKPLNHITSAINFLMKHIPSRVGIYAAPFIGICCEK